MRRDFVPGQKVIRSSFDLRQSAVEVRFLRVCQLTMFARVDDAIPDGFDELDSIVKRPGVNFS